MKRLFTSWTLLCVLIQLWAQAPSGYYTDATGSKGKSLKRRCTRLSPTIRREATSNCGPTCKVPTGEKTEKYGTCTLLPQISLLPVTNAALTRMKEIVTTENTHSPKVGLTTPVRCTPTCSICILQTAM